MYPLIEREMRLVGTEQTLSINRDDIVNSTVSDCNAKYNYAEKIYSLAGSSAGCYP
jgi:hypothetical protein